MAQAQTPNPTAAMVVIGDEILSGRTRDSNLHHLAKELTLHGITLAEARVIGDVPELIAETVRKLSETYTYVFTSGGIGPTHDDITADSVAAAFGVPIDVRDDARAILESHYAVTKFELNAARLRMARIPDGATLIVNPVSGAPGFSLQNVHVMAGVPRIFEAMLDGLLPGLAKGNPVLSRHITVSLPEGEVAATLGAFAERYSDLSFGSYPMFDKMGHRVNLVVRGTDGDRVARAITELADALGVALA
ncbi:MAG: molybdopterin-binding protein [Pseudomonadota bacterium]